MSELEILTSLIGDNNGPISLSQMLARAFVVFCFGLLLLRITTPRLFGKATPVDIILTVIIGSNLSRTLTGNAPFYEVMVTTAFLVGLHAGITWLAARWKPLADLIKGKPRVLVSDGEIDEESLKRYAIGRRDLLAAVHAEGGTALTDIEHATLERDGEIEIGPRWRKQLLGGHLKSYRLNQSAIGICLVGNFEQTRPSKKQLQALTQLVDWLQRDVLRKRTRFAGHKELPGEKTVCPGKYFPLKTLHRRYG